MHSLGQLVKRDCLVFLRDKASVFFSLMSMFIILMLMVLFLGDSNVNNIIYVLNKYGTNRDTVLDKENAAYLVQMWTIAGILVVNAVTVCLTVIGVMVNDIENHRLESFYTAPLSRAKVAAGYIISAILIGIFFCLITFAVSEIYVIVTGGDMLSAEATCKVILNIILNVCVFSVLMYLIAIMVKSTSAWSGIATIVGTLVGFVGGIYLPIGTLPSGVANVLKFTPVLHGTALMREILCEDAMTKTFSLMPQECINAFREEMGIDIVVNNSVVSSVIQYGFILLFGVAMGGVILLILHRQKVNDR